MGMHTNEALHRLGVEIRVARVRAGLTQDALAARAGVSRATVSKLERGQVDPSVTTVVRIAKALGVSVGTLFGED